MTNRYTLTRGDKKHYSLPESLLYYGQKYKGDTEVVKKDEGVRLGNKHPQPSRED